MQSIEKNNSMLSDITYEAFEIFIKEILPDILIEGLKKARKQIVITIENTDVGVIIHNHNLGRINYQEFVNYLYQLDSLISYKLDVRLIKDKISLLFNFKQLTINYNDFLQADEYTYNKDNNTQISKINNVSQIFTKSILPNIIEDVLNEKYDLQQILNNDGKNIANILYLPIEIRHKDLYIGEYNLGKVNGLMFLNYLETIPFYLGLNPSSDMVTFDFNQLYSLYAKGITR